MIISEGTKLINNFNRSVYFLIILIPATCVSEVCGIGGWQKLVDLVLETYKGLVVS